MSKGSVKLSIKSSYDPTGTKAATAAIEAFTREYGVVTETENGKISSLDATTASLVDQSVAADQLAAKWSSASDRMVDAGSKLTAGVTVPIVAVAAAATNTALNFDSSMSQLSGALNVPVDSLDKLRQLAIDTGNSTIYSAQKSASAMTELAKGGLTEADIEGGALASTMALAAAGGLDLADSANTIVQVMGAFGMSASQSSEAANALAGAANASSSDVSDLTQGLSQCAAQANNAGWDIQSTTAVLAAFSDAGIVGSDAGTSLKTALQRLSAPTDEAATMMQSLGIDVRDSSGNLLSASGVAQELQDKLGGLTSAERDQALQTIFGSDASRAALVLMEEGSAGIEKYTAATSDQTAAQRMADAQMSEGQKAIEQMKGALETAGITIGENVAPMVTQLANAVADMADRWGDLDEGTQQAIITLAGVAAAAGPVLTIFGKLTGVGASVAKSWAKLTAEAARNSAANAADAASATAAATATNTETGSVTKATAAAVAKTAAQKALNVVMAAGKMAAVGLAIYGIARIAEEYQQAKEHGDKLAKATQSITSLFDAGKSSAETYGTTLTASMEQITAQSESTAKSVSDLVDSAAEFSDSCTSTAAELQGNANQLDYYMGIINQLADQSNLTAAQQTQLKDAVDGVNQICGTSISVLDAQNGKLSLQKDVINDLTAGYQLYAQAQAYAELYGEAVKGQAEAQVQAKQSADAMDAIIGQLPAEYQAAATAIKDGTATTEDNYKINELCGGQYRQLALDLRSNAQSYSDATATADGYASKMDTLQQMQTNANSALEASPYYVEQYLSSLSSFPAYMQGCQISIGDFSTALSNAGVSTDSLSGITDEDLVAIAQAWATNGNDIVAALAQYGVDITTQVGDTGTQAADSAAANSAAAAGAVDANGAVMASAADSHSQDMASAIGINTAAAAAAAGANATQAGANVASGLSSQQSSVSTAASGLASAQDAANASGSSYGWGADLGYNLASGLGDSNVISNVVGAASHLAGLVAGFLHQSTADVGPWRYTDKWGVDLVGNLVTGMRSGEGDLQAEAARIADIVDLPAMRDASTASARVAYGTPSTTGRISGGTVINNWHVTVQAKDLADVKTVEQLFARLESSSADAELRESRAS